MTNNTDTEPKPKINTVKQLERFPFAPTVDATPKQIQRAILQRIDDHNRAATDKVDKK